MPPEVRRAGIGSGPADLGPRDDCPADKAAIRGQVGLATQNQFWRIGPHGTNSPVGANRSAFRRNKLILRGSGFLPTGFFYRQARGRCLTLLVRSRRRLFQIGMMFDGNIIPMWIIAGRLLLAEKPDSAFPHHVLKTISPTSCRCCPRSNPAGCRSSSPTPTNSTIPSRWRRFVTSLRKTSSPTASGSKRELAGRTDAAFRFEG